MWYTNSLYCTDSAKRAIQGYWYRDHCTTICMVVAVVLCLGVFGSTQSLHAQQPRHTMSGVVYDASTKTPLQAVSVWVEGTKTGTMTDRNGRYLLRLSSGEHILVFSMIGYNKHRDTIVVQNDSVQRNVFLSPADALLQEVVVTAQTPANVLMRKVLAHKKQQQDSLQTYSYLLYSKFVASADTLTAGRASGNGDTSIIAILESYSRGWFAAPNRYFNEIVQRRQSANIPPQANLVAFGTNINAYDDYVTILGEEIATPFHTDALDFYDFAIAREYRDNNGSTIVRLILTPSGGRKLFSGTIDIDKTNLLPISVHLQPNKAVQLPFEAQLTYTQLFEQMAGRFLIPTGLRIESSMQADILWVLSPRLDVLVETIAYNYIFNEPTRDELFEQRRVEVAETAETFDSTFWYNQAVLPLRADEEKAYRDIQTMRDTPDSLERTTIFDKALRPVTQTIALFARKPFTGWQDILRYNRVHGLYAGLGATAELTPWLSSTLRVGYGTADARWYADGSLNFALDSLKKYTLYANGYSKLIRRDNPYIVSMEAITLMSLFLKNDYGDYFYATGGEAGIEAGFGQLRFVRRDEFVRPTRLRLFFRSEDHASAGVNTEFSVLGGSTPFRANPPAFNGTLRSFGVEFNWNYHPTRRFANIGVQVQGEIAEPSFMPSDFRFRQVQSVVFLRTPTLPLWELTVRFMGGWSFGDIPPQRFFSLESSSSAIANAGALRGLRVKEFYGDRFATLSLQHNFGEVIPGVLRIPNIASFGIEFMLHTGVGWSQFSEQARSYTATELASTHPLREQVYYEVGVSLNKILLLLRADVTARLSQVSSPKVFFTVGLAQF